MRVSQRLLCIGVWLVAAVEGALPVQLHVAVEGRQVVHGQQKLAFVLGELGLDLKLGPEAAAHITVRPAVLEAEDSETALEAFELRATKGGVAIDAGGASGAMYGLLSLASHVRDAAARGVEGWPALVAALRPETAAPRFGYRALKFNMPISAYRSGDGTRQNFKDFVDLDFWESFLDMMAENRYNVITLWGLHPWPFMVTPENFTKAASFSDTENWGGEGTETEEYWQQFWTSLFKMAKDRGVDPYIIDWNIFVSEGYKQHYDQKAITDHDGSGGNGTANALANRYGREVITQVIDSYPDLAGIGVTLGERMKNLGEDAGDLKPQVQFIEEVVLAALEQAKRKVNLIYRAALDNHEPTIVRDSIDAFVMRTAIKVWVQLKFNWSHGHSTTKLIHAHGGGTGSGYWEPAPKHYKMAWMVRNEDFHFLRWGQAPFIRAHIAENGHDFVGGYITGSEEHIPATDFASLASAEERGWKYDFERQWLFYMQWGRLLFDPETPDEVFASTFSTKFGLSQELGSMLLQAHQNASVVPLRFASFVWNTWDFTLHSEDMTVLGHQYMPVTDLLTQKVLDTTSMQSIHDFLQQEAPSALQAQGQCDASDFKSDTGSKVLHFKEVKHVSDAGACCALCAWETDCTHFTWQSASSKCDLKAGAPEWTSASGHVAGQVHDAPPAPTPAPTTPGPTPAPLVVACAPPNFCTPPAVAAELETAATAALALAGEIRCRVPEPAAGLEAELSDVETWAHMGMYFALKLRGAVALGRFQRDGHHAQQNEAVDRLTEAAEQWRQVCALTSSHMHTKLPLSDNKTVSWTAQQDGVNKDIDLAKQSAGAVLI